MIADTNTYTKSPPFRSNPEETLTSPITEEVCINWTDVAVPNSTSFHPSGVPKLSYYASTSVTCDDPGNAHFRFSLYLTGSNSPDTINDLEQSQMFLAYTGKACNNPSLRMPMYHTFIRYSDDI